ncbi:MAG TPA: hypothetical protein EYP60_03915 [bacterium (Candidatus Stahlbacteria)]|nr:hypothetical protein [Candidatus Stahlbacteria bacterium]
MAKEYNMLIADKIKEVLSAYDRVEYGGCDIYIVDKKGLDEIKLLEFSLKGMEELPKEQEVTKKRKKGPLFEYAKLLNPDYPAFKYNFFMKHTPLEIFDRKKIFDRIPREFSVWKNIQIKRLNERIEKSDPPLSEAEVEKLKRELDDIISIEEQNIKDITDNFDEYHVIITSHAKQNYYPSAYLIEDLVFDIKDTKKEQKKKHRSRNVHLRKHVPNILWFCDRRKYVDLRPNDKVGRIVRTHTAFCDTIYVKKFSELEEGVDK